jgi:hypothetical protein
MIRDETEESAVCRFFLTESGLCGPDERRRIFILLV